MNTINEVLKNLEEYGEVVEIIETETGKGFKSFRFSGYAYIAIVKCEHMPTIGGNGSYKYTIEKVLTDW